VNCGPRTPRDRRRPRRVATPARCRSWFSAGVGAVPAASTATGSR